MDFEEKRGDRHAQAEKKKADAHADKLRRDAEAKEKAEREMVKQAGMRIAEAANPKVPPMTFARKAGL
jgi:regulator of protease activity HflC (stomatin/prohibitin superfamily)